MAESKTAWDQVGQEFRELGRQIRQHYEQQPRPAGETGETGSAGPEGQPGQAGQGSAGAPGDQGAGPAADRRKVDDALEKLRDSLEQAFSALGDAIRDPQFGDQTKKAAGSLSDALTATFAEASERFRKK
ncbi:MAG TPA: hypothetical protein VHM23_09920 [Actinomycetota bacterium]|jgi:hypothetical protein|nr:hypothetical protein [Actinomycetota bacterium]